MNFSIAKLIETNQNIIETKPKDSNELRIVTNQKIVMFVKNKIL